MLQLPTLVLFILLLFILLLPMGDDDDDDVGTTTANDDDDDDAVVAVPRRPGRKSRVGNVISLSLSLSFGQCHCAISHISSKGSMRTWYLV